MAQYTNLDKVYADRVTVASIIMRTWSRIFLGTFSPIFKVESRPSGFTAVHSVKFPINTADEAYTGAALSTGSYTTADVEIDMTQQNSVTIALTALATLTAVNDQDVESIGSLADGYIYNQNENVSSLMLSGIGWTSGVEFTHSCNNDGAGSSVNPITAGLVHLGAGAASLTEASGVLAGANLSPDLVRQAVTTLRGRGTKPWTMIQGQPLYLCIAQSNQINKMKSNSAFQDVSNFQMGNSQGLFGAAALVYEGCVFISVEDAFTLSSVGASRADTAQYAIFCGGDYISKPYLHPELLPGGNGEGSEKMKLYDEAEIRIASTTVDAPINAGRTAAYYMVQGLGILNPKAGIKYILHPDAA